MKLGVVDGNASVSLAAAGAEVTFVPAAGMLSTALRYHGEDYLHAEAGGIPILHPWANRLREPGFKVAGTSVDFSQRSGWRADPNGLPIHGTMTGQPDWEVLRVAADAKAAALVARFDYAEHDELMAMFPFPHSLEVVVRVEPIIPAPRGRSTAPKARVVIGTTIRATGRRRVPVSFGWHPYFRLPGVKRADVVLGLPQRDHLDLDDRQLPTGHSRREGAEARPLGKRELDDAFKLGRDRCLSIEGGGRRLAVEFDRTYPWAQVYAPAPESPSNWFVCLEPMTAPTDALSTDTAPLIPPGGAFTARFSITMSAP